MTTWTQARVEAERPSLVLDELIPTPAFRLVSSSFQDLRTLPNLHARDYENESPPLAWTAPPDGTQSLAVILEDGGRLKTRSLVTIGSERGHVTHWLAWDLDPALRELGPGAELGTSGTNAFGVIGYTGPFRIEARVGRTYVFSLLALECALGLGEGATRAEFDAAAYGHVLATASLVGRFPCFTRSWAVRVQRPRL